MYLAMLDKLICYCEAKRKFELGLLYGTLILRYDRAHERTHRRLMNLHYLSGDRTAALRQFERCAAALEEASGTPRRPNPTKYNYVVGHSTYERRRPAGRDGTRWHCRALVAVDDDDGARAEVQPALLYRVAADYQVLAIAVGEEWLATRER